MRHMHKPKTNIYTSSYKHTNNQRSLFFVLTSELKRSWQMLQEITCFFLGGMETPNVWLITAFWTGSIWKTKSRGTLEGAFTLEILAWTRVCLLSEFESFSWCKRGFLKWVCTKKCSVHNGYKGNGSHLRMWTAINDVNLASFHAYRHT